MSSKDIILHLFLYSISHLESKLFGLLILPSVPLFCNYVHLFIHNSLSTYYVLGTVLGTSDTNMSTT